MIIPCPIISYHMQHEALPKYDLQIACPLPAGVFNVTLISVEDTPDHYMRSQIAL